MPSKEKALKGIVCCLNEEGVKNFCGNCPYEEKADCCRALLRDVKQLLMTKDKNQPIKRQVMRWRCKKCKAEGPEERNICPYCGGEVLINTATGIFE